MSHADAPPSPAPTRTELQLVLELARDSDSALPRVFSILHRRCCRVTEVSLRPDSDRLELRVAAPPRHAGSVARWLGALVDVRSVSERSAAPAGGCAPA